jgi:hypothetical protein
MPHYKNKTTNTAGLSLFYIFLSMALVMIIIGKA